MSSIDTLVSDILLGVYSNSRGWRLILSKEDNCYEEYSDNVLNNVFPKEYTEDIKKALIKEELLK